MAGVPGHQFQQRQNSLTEEDLQAIAAIVESIHHKKMQNYTHVCQLDDEINDIKLVVGIYKRFANVNPDDIMAVIDTHKKLAEIVSDSKTVVRRTVLGIMVVVFTGLMTKGFWATLWEKMK